MVHFEGDSMCLMSFGYVCLAAAVSATVIAALHGHFLMAIVLAIRLLIAC